MLLVHGLLARAERPARQRRLAAPAVIPHRRGDGRPILLVQCESFFDARNLSPLIPRELLPAFDACSIAALTAGHLEVPGWGANTTRTEFAVLTGIPETELGYDRFNPYYALARVPITSQVWQLRAAGYRTICLHPFDRRFYRRDLVMPALGFDTFLGREALGGARAPPYRSDPDLGCDMLHVLDQSGPRTFVFAITMGNHGPWHGAAATRAAPSDSVTGSIADSDRMPQGRALQRYIDGLRRSDTMLGILAEGLDRRGGGLLGFYGDHPPSLPGAFRHLGFEATQSDYLIWSAEGASRRRPRHCELAASQLGKLIVEIA